jgi:hypothetical protein
MTISSTTTQTLTPCNGTTTQFAFANKIFSAADLTVTLIDVSGNLYAFTLSGTNTYTNATTGLSYTVFNIDVDAGCFIVFTGAPTNGWSLDMRTSIAELQSTSIKNQSSFYPELHEEFFDKATRMLQDLLRKTYTFGIHGPDIEETAWAALPLPASRKGLSLVFDPVAGLPVCGVPTTQTLTQALIGLLLTPQTTAESTASVTPVNIWYPPGAIERYYTGSGDARTAIQNALNSNNRVYSFYGLQTAFPVSNYLLVPADVTLENASLISTAAVTQYAGWGADHQAQLVLLNGNQAKARGLQINCAGYATGGIGIRNYANNDASENEIYNGLSQGILILCSLGPGILGAYNFTANGNRIYYMTNGIQHWRARGGAITGNSVRVIGSGGIWGSGSANVVATGNYISHCQDVGLDMEGGINNCYSGNSVTSCQNGEITWFLDGSGSGANPTNCKIVGNSAYHTTTMIRWNGVQEVSASAITNITQAASAVVTSTDGGTANPFAATTYLYFAAVGGMTQINGLTGLVTATGGSVGAWTATVAINSSAFSAYTSGGTASPAGSPGGAGLYLTSATNGQTQICFSKNTIRADVGNAFLVNQLYSPGSEFDCGFIVDGNEFSSTATLHTVQTAWNIQVRGNLFRGLVGAELNINYFKDCSEGVWDSNLYFYTNTPSGSVYALQYYTDVAAAHMPTAPQITNNRFVNCGDNAFKHQAFTSGVGAVLSGNLFTTGYTANAGCTVTTDGYPVLRGQKLYYTFTGTTTAALNLTAVVALGNSLTYSEGLLNCFAGGVLGANYSFTYASNGPTVISRDGSGTGTGNPTSATRYATFAGSTITVTGPAASAVVANMTLEVTTNQ